MISLGFLLTGEFRAFFFLPRGESGGGFLFLQKIFLALCGVAFQIALDLQCLDALDGFFGAIFNDYAGFSRPVFSKAGFELRQADVSPGFRRFDDDAVY